MYSGKMSQQEEMYWTREGSRTAAFLLVIPGAALFGFGYGLISNLQIPGAIMGTGAGLMIWGLIVALRKRERLS